MKTTEQKIITSAIGWWKNHRPLVWSHKKHLENPTVNCMSPSRSEKLLAKSVAKFIKEKRAAATKEQEDIVNTLMKEANEQT